MTQQSKIGFLIACFFLSLTSFGFSTIENSIDRIVTNQNITIDVSHGETIAKSPTQNPVSSFSFLDQFTIESELDEEDTDEKKDFTDHVLVNWGSVLFHSNAPPIQENLGATIELCLPHIFVLFEVFRL